MFTENNTYRMDVGEHDMRAWNLDEIYLQLNWLYSKGRNKVNGNYTFKTRLCPGFMKMRGEGRWQRAFTHQDTVKRRFAEIELTGEMATLCIATPFGKVVLNPDLCQFFMHNSEIANIYVSGWIVTAE